VSENGTIAYINRSNGGVPKLHVITARINSMVPGVCFETDDVRLMITSYTTPCRTIRESFTDHHISRISQKVHPGWSRVYARVLREGTVSVGDGINLMGP
jgi:MOSC domain-containing protein YiiM